MGKNKSYSVYRRDLITKDEFPSSAIDVSKSDALALARRKNDERDNQLADVFIVKKGEKVIYVPDTHEILDNDISLR